MKPKANFLTPLFIVVMLLSTSFSGHSQNQNEIDSLQSLIKMTSSDTIKCNAHYELGRIYRKKAIDKALKSFISAEKIILMHLEGDKKPNPYYLKKYPDILNIKGVTFRKLENYTEALKSYFKAQDIYIKQNDTIGIATTNFNIGAIYRHKEEYVKSNKYYTLSLELREGTNNPKGVINCYNALGINQRKLKNNALALSYYKKSFDLSEQSHDTVLMIQSYINLSVILTVDSNLVPAIVQIKKALVLSEQIKNKDAIANCKNQLSAIYLRQNEYDLCIKYGLEAFELYEKRKNNRKKMNASLRLSSAYKAKGNFKRAYEFLNKHKVLVAQLTDENQTKSLVRIEMNHFFEKQNAADSVARFKEIEITDLELKEQKAQIAKNDAQKLVLYGGLFLLLIVAGLILRGYIRKKKDNATITEAKEKSEELLLNILPKETAEELKKYGSAKTRSYDLVSVLFTDFKGFTMISEILSPEELVAEIDYCYKEFDRITTKYTIEKIKTIGDAYMCAGGLPAVSKTHAKNTVMAGLEIRDFMLAYKKEKEAKGQPGFEIRIGIHTGPVVAGIVGIKKFAYDIWGDAVNTAARMESSGSVGKVNISNSTYEIIKDDFDCEYRGKVAAKNKGEIDMYYVENKKS